MPNLSETISELLHINDNKLKKRVASLHVCINDFGPNGTKVPTLVLK